MDQESQLRLTRVNGKIKVVIIIILKSDSVVNYGKAQVRGWEGQHGLNRVNVWIKIVLS
jgi:hypothetical protein